MAKKTTKPQTVVQDFRIDIRSADRSRKDLSKWRQAIQSAENILRPSRDLLYNLYEDIILDDHLVSVMAQRRLSITTSSIVFQNDGKEVDSINKLIETEAFEQMLEHIIDSRFWGYSLIKADFTAKKTELVPRAHVVPTKGLVVTRPSDTEGIDYTKPPFTNLYFTAGKENDLGLILIATPLVLIKRGDLSDWAQFNEIFGQPTRVGKYDPNMPGHREQMQEALKEAGALAYLVIPTGSELEHVETANKSGAADTYGNLYDRMESGMSKVIVGQTMTTENGSSRSQAEVHERVANKISLSDRKFVKRILNEEVRALLLAQGFAEAAQGEFQFVDEEELKKSDMLKMDLDIHRTVGPLKKSYYAENYNVEFVDEADLPEPTNEPETEKEPVKNKPSRKGLKLVTATDFFV